jgi:spore germination cell wall hydrolase CwlJ-like protein
VSKKLRIASAISVAASLFSTLFASAGSGAKAQDLQMQVAEAPGASAITRNSAIAAPVPTIEAAPQPEVHNAVETDAVAPVAQSATSLADLVADTAVPAALSREMECLAGAIYFEAKSETMAGQLAVGRVIVARANSGRFPTSYCGVVLQPSQFSFVRGRAIPAVNRDSHAWQQAVKIAMIADKGSWKSPAEGAMFFHAASVSPSWGKTRVARIDNHIFYR